MNLEDLLCFLCLLCFFVAMTREQFIRDVWERLGKEVVGASELELIEKAFLEHFGSPISPASIARVLADHGARLGHPEILQAYTSWRDKQSLFTSDDLEFGNLEAALRLVNKVEQLRQQFESEPPLRESLRQAVRSLKSELDLIPSSKPLAAEVAQWLTVWLQNPQLFAEWLSLRQNTTEFRERFLS
jgi:hypothetical protein